jgi:hypothetical protein
MCMLLITCASIYGCRSDVRASAPASLPRGEDWPAQALCVATPLSHNMRHRLMAAFAGSIAAENDVVQL